MRMNSKCKDEIALQIFYVFNRAILVADMHVKYFDLVFYMHILVAWISKHYYFPAVLDLIMISAWNFLFALCYSYTRLITSRPINSNKYNEISKRKNTAL